MQLQKNKFVQNTGWIIGGKVFQMILALFIGIVSARYLGPANYGIINYTLSFTSFFTALCTLGLNATIIKELIDNPNQQGVILGSGIGIRCLSSIMSVISILILIFILNPNDPLLLVVGLLQAIALFFQSFDLIDYWYQSNLKSKYPSIIQSIAYIIVSIYKIYILFTAKSVQWFAFSNSFDVALIALLLLWSYKKHGGQKLIFSFAKAKAMLAKSYHFILSGLMVAVYGQIDKIMIGKFLTTTDVGLYSTAINICNMWTFILSAIIDSARPVITEMKATDNKTYIKRITQLYSGVIWVSVFVAAFVTIFSRQIIHILYGEKYIEASSALIIAIWYCAFAYLGVARSVWIVCENKSRYEKKFAVWGAVINVVLNFFLIPLLGINGAAVATLVTQIFTNVIIPTIYKETRENSVYMLHGFLLKGVINKEKIFNRNN